MKKVLFVLIFLYSTIKILFPIKILAKRNCCVLNGGTCGCRCCDGTRFSSLCALDYPECIGGSSIPTCSLHSYYNIITKSCECYSGYLLSGNRCISQREYCQIHYGSNYEYDISSGTCKCKFGDGFDTFNCISGAQYCWSRYGQHSSYDILVNNCRCSQGYSFNSQRTRCISEDDWCREQLGLGSKYESIQDDCICLEGYKLEGNNCKLDKSSEFGTSVIEDIPENHPSSTFYPFKSLVPDSRQEITPSLTEKITGKVTEWGNSIADTFETLSRMLTLGWGDLKLLLIPIFKGGTW